jgi:tetratricopeptide (TPR) repeat protein
MAHLATLTDNVYWVVGGRAATLVRRPAWQIMLAVVCCVLLAIVVGMVAAALDPKEGVSVADLAAVALTCLALAGSLLVWAKGIPALRTHDLDSWRDVPSAAVPRQLPAAVAGFAGRAAELSTLTSLLERSADAAGGVVICAVDGTAGIGKSALAVCWAHRVSDRFPGGQLYVNLRGFDPAAPPMAPAEAVRTFLDAFEVPAERIPAGLVAQSSLLRSILATRRVLVVLDNARDAAQVRPLLPGSGGCFVLVTSRTRLTRLIAAEGARPLTLAVLSDAEARELLARRLGPERVTVEPNAAEEIIDLCARLPLALSVVAARAAMHPGFSLATLAEELRRARGGLQAFEGGADGDDVRAVFSWSYERLDPTTARLFRLLGLHPGPDITAAAAASLAGLGAAQVRPALAELAHYHLVAEQVAGRYSCHDLLRAYARELVHTHDSPSDRDASRRRMFDHYLHTAHGANLRLHPRWGPISIAAPVAGVAPEEIADHVAAQAWFEAEHPVLLGVVQLAATTGDPSAWQLPSVAAEFLCRRGYWDDVTAAQQTALCAAVDRGDRLGEAYARHGLGHAFAWSGRYDEAYEELRRAIAIFEALDDPLGQVDCYNRLTGLSERQGNLTEALTLAKRALELARTAGSPRGLAQTLNDIGWFYALLGEPGRTLTYCHEAMAFCREAGHRRIEGNILDSLGYAHHLCGDHDRAIELYQRSLAIKGELDDRYGYATELDHLGDAYLAVGDRQAARDAWRRATRALDNLGLARAGIGPGFPDSDEIAAKIHRLDALGKQRRASRSDTPQ